MILSIDLPALVFCRDVSQIISNRERKTYPRSEGLPSRHFWREDNQGRLPRGLPISTGGSEADPAQVIGMQTPNRERGPMNRTSTKL